MCSSEHETYAISRSMTASREREPSRETKRRTNMDLAQAGGPATNTPTGFGDTVSKLSMYHACARDTVGMSTLVPTLLTPTRVPSDRVDRTGKSSVESGRSVSKASLQGDTLAAIPPPAALARSGGIASRLFQDCHSPYSSTK